MDWNNAESLPESYPRGLRDSSKVAPLERRHKWLILCLVIACAIPRLLMSIKMDIPCKDGVYYLSISAALECGDFETAFARDHLNVYPAILMGLHQLGIEWQTAAELWGLLVSSLVVLPLFGWLRRRFDVRIATLACILYAFHGNLIEWSIEPIRDATFLLIVTSTLYFAWRAATENRVAMYPLTGCGLTLAVFTRFEGWFLLIPIVAWAGYRALHYRGERRNTALGLFGCAAAIPLTIVLVNLCFLRGWDRWETPRIEHLQSVQTWFAKTFSKTPAETYKTPAETPVIAVSAPEVKSEAKRGDSKAWIFVYKLEKGFEAIFGILALVGIYRHWRVFTAPDQLALSCISVLTLAGIWVVLCYAGTVNSRYVSPLVIFATPYASFGLLWITERLVRRIDGFVGQDWPRGTVVYGLLVFYAIFGICDALSTNHAHRIREARERETAALAAAKTRDNR